jgi:ribosome-binding factor A
MEKPQSFRIQKLNSLIQQRMAVVLPEYLEGQNALVTVTKVETSRDLKWAKVWLSILGGSDDLIFDTLKKNIYDIQGELNHILPIKVMPRIQFFLDTTARHAARINEVLHEIHEEEDNHPNI